MEKCECACGCDATGTRWDETSWVCDICGDYYLDGDGEAVCPREQDDRTCRRCDENIAWGPIMTGRSGTPNTRYGVCWCRQWSQTDHGGTWRLAEGEAVTNDDIDHLREEAAVAGDLVMAAVAEAALRGNLAARAKCVQTISDARAQEKEEEDE